MRVIDKFHHADEKTVDDSVKTLHLYRIGYSNNDFEHYIAATELELVIYRYLVIKESNSSYFIRDHSIKRTRRVVNKLSNKKFAYNNVKGALWDFSIRANRRTGYLTNQLRVAEKTLELVKEELKTNK